MIRSRRSIKQIDAEKALEHPPFDICWRYADMLNNFTICCVLLFLPSSYGWKTMLCLAGTYAGFFALDRYFLLYASSQTPYETFALSRAFCVGWSVPTGVLASLVAFWAVHARLFTTWPGNSWWACAIAFGAHVAAYLLLSWLLHGRSEIEEQTYASFLKQQKRPLSYFTA